MILLAAAFLAGDAWTWEVSLRYDDPVEGVLVNDRERWSVRVGKESRLMAERVFVGSVVGDGELIPSGNPTPETLKGEIKPDGTLDLKGDWSDRDAARLFRRLLNPDKTLTDRVAEWPIVRRASLRLPGVELPGSGIRATLHVEATLVSARLGGQEIEIKKPKL